VATFDASSAGKTVGSTSVAALTGDDGTTSEASTPATAIHSGRRERVFMTMTSEE
jgi:hypothetical protein